MKKLLTAALSLAQLGSIAIPALAVGPEPAQVIAPVSEEAVAAPGFEIEIGGKDSGTRAHIMVPLQA